MQDAENPDIARWSQPPTLTRRTNYLRSDRKPVVNVIETPEAEWVDQSRFSPDAPFANASGTSPLGADEDAESGILHSVTKLENTANDAGSPVHGGSGSPTILVNTSQLARVQNTHSIGTAASSRVGVEDHQIDAYAHRMGQRVVAPLQFIYQIMSHCGDQEPAVLCHASGETSVIPQRTDPRTHERVQMVDGLHGHGRAAVMHRYHGAGGSSPEAQLAVEEEAARPPLGCKQMPLHGDLWATSALNPTYLHAAILLVPLIFYCITFCVIFGETSTPHNYIPAAKMTNYLSDLITYLSEEQAQAAKLTALAAQRRFYSGDAQKDFYAVWRAEQFRYVDSQGQVDLAIGRAAGIASRYEEKLTKKLNGISPWLFIDTVYLSETRVFALVSTNNDAIMTRYEDLLRHVLLFNGALSLTNYLAVETDIVDLQSIFATNMDGVINSLIVYFAMKKAEAGVKDEIAMPKSIIDIDFIALVQTSIRTSETTLRYPSDPTRTANYLSSSGLSAAALSFINEDDSLFDVIIPPLIQEQLRWMQTTTYKGTAYTGFDPTTANNCYNTAVNFAAQARSVSAVSVGTLFDARTTSESVRTGCLIALFIICVLGLLYHILKTIKYQHSMGLHRSINSYAHQLRASVQRMHSAAVKMVNLRVEQMDVEQRLSRRTKLRSITSLERELYVSTTMLRRLEPYLPLPVRRPPPGAPQEALVSGLFIKPCLLTRKDLVAILLDFSTVGKGGEEKIVTGNYGSGASVLGGATSVHFERSVMSSTVMEGTQPSVAGGNRLSKQPTVKEQNLRAALVFKLLQCTCRLVNAHMPSSKTGAFVEQNGETAVVWINLCEEVQSPSLIAFSVCTNVEQYAEQNSIECPQMIICCADGVVGNIPSFDPSVPALRPMADYQAMWSKSALFAESGGDGVRKQQGGDAAVDISSEVKGGLGTDFVNAAEGMSKKTRAIYWLRQLVSGPIEVKETTPLLKTTDVQNSALATDVFNADNGDCALLPMKVSPEYAPDPSAANLTTFIVLGDIAKELAILQNLLYIHRQPILGNDRAIRQIWEEKCAFDSAYDAGDDSIFSPILSDGANHSMHSPLLGQNSWEHIDLEDEEENQSGRKDDSVVEKAAEDSSIIGVSAVVSGVPTTLSQSLIDSVSTANHCGAVTVLHWLRRVVPQGIAIDSVEYRRRLTPIETAGKKKKSRRDAEEGEEIDVAREFPPYIQDPESGLRFTDYARSVHVKVPVQRPTAEGISCQYREVVDLRPVFAVKWDCVSSGLISVSDSSIRQLTSVNYMRHTNDESSALLAAYTEWMQLYGKHAAFAQAVTALAPTSQIVSRDESEQLRSMGQEIRNDVQMYRTLYPLNHVGLMCGARMLDVVELVLNCLERGPLLGKKRCHGPFSPEVLEVLRFEENTVL